MADRNAYVQPQVGNQGFSRTMKTLGGRVSLLTTDLAVGKTTAAFVVPKGFVVTGIIAVSTDLDSNGSPTLTLSVGDAASGVRYLSASTIGQAGTSTQTLASTGLLYENTADTEIVITATAAAATAVAGTIDLYLSGFMK
jgi:hypothetical protein